MPAYIAGRAHHTLGVAMPTGTDKWRHRRDRATMIVCEDIGRIYDICNVMES